MPDEISAQTQAILDDMARYEPRAMMTQAPIVWEHADGHVITDLDWDTDRLTSRSRKAGLEVLSVRRIAVSSEDVFVSLIRSEQAD